MTSSEIDWPAFSRLLTVQVPTSLWSWWTVVALLALANYKSLPGTWTARTLYHFNTSFSRGARHTVPSPTSENPKRRVAIVQKASPSDSIQEHHPLFQADIISTHVSLFELDFNMHKSNSTYFTDLDVARIKLLGRIIAPAWPMNNMRIEYKGRDGIARRERVRGRAALVLGATYTSFKREMAAFASYDVESRILGWDSRWLFVGSWFVSRKGKPRQISASSLSKYIIKKGRITVKPEQFLSESGWITSRRDEIGSADAQMASGSWTWQEIEEQRVKGMAVVDTWGAADLRLEKMYSDEKAQ